MVKYNKKRGIMNKIIMIVLLTFSLCSNAAVVVSKDQREKNAAVAIFLNKNSEEKDIAKSILTFEKFAAYDNLMLFYLGKANYELTTDLLTLNQAKGRNYIEKAAVKGVHLAEYAYSVILMKENKFATAISYLKASANRNNRDAQYTLGKMYYLGDGVPRSKKNGFTLISAAAKNGNPDAQYDLAKVYFSQKNEKIQKNGVYWLKSAVVNGNLNACDELYKLYFGGILVEHNKKKHIEYLNCSANNNNSDAKYLLATYYATGKYVEKNAHKSGYWFKSLAEEEDPEASVHYSNYIFNYFKNDRKKIRTAIEYLDRVSKINIDAAMTLGNIYKEGLYGVSSDKSEAIKHFESAKNLGSETAQYKIIELLDK